MPPQQGCGGRQGKVARLSWEEGFCLSPPPCLVRGTECLGSLPRQSHVPAPSSCLTSQGLRKGEQQKSDGEGRAHVQSPTQ